jgi:hypothetical protein
MMGLRRETFFFRGARVRGAGLLGVRAFFMPVS